MNGGTAESRSYLARLAAPLRYSLVQLARAPSHPRRKQAASKLARQLLLLSAILGTCIVGLMIALDVRAIAVMPLRDSPGLRPVRILTDFGKDAYVLYLLMAILVVVALASPLLRETNRAGLLRIGVQAQYLFLAVLFPVLVTEVLKWVAGRGRPFVGGKANPFNFVPFAGTEAYFSFPSSHAVTAFALAFAVGAIWPHARRLMFAYAVLIAASRLVLLAHHPSDVVAGALIGVAGAMTVRYWFAARQVGFDIRNDGKIVSL
jgi:membrane-associated phospholipid phosphatase